MLEFIVAVTLTAPDLDAVEHAYGRWLDYAIVERGRIGEQLADAWGAPRMTGRRYVLMQPASGEPVYLRFVEQASVEGYAPLRTRGWNATEILVADPDGLAARLRGSPFRIVGEPRPLSMNPDIRAMQVVGPANELLYLTRIPPGKSAFNLGSAKTDVDRVFIVVLGGADVAAMLDFYRSRFALSVREPSPARVGVLNEAYGLPPEHEIQLAIVRLPQSFLIEVDGYPAEAIERPVPPGELPPGMAMVSFEIAALDSVDLEFLRPPRNFMSAPYDGRRAAVTRGAAGELIELIESGNGAELLEEAEELEERED